VYWASTAAGVDVSNDVLVEFTFWPSTVGGSPTGTVELVLRASNISSVRPVEQPVCNTSVLANTNVCSAAEGETNFVVPSSDPNPAQTCADACCAQNKTCGAWVVLPQTNFDDKNCTCSSSTCTCCWLKPTSCSNSEPRDGCTAGFLNEPPPQPEPLPRLSGYVVAANFSAQPPTLSLTRVPSGGGAAALLGSFNLSSIENGVVDGWSIVRVAMRSDGTIDVWMNPFFREFGFVGNSSDAERIAHAPAPRISAKDASPLPPGGLAIASGNAPPALAAEASAARVDYVSVLKVDVL
jgi:hypothetical protein